MDDSAEGDGVNPMQSVDSDIESFLRVRDYCKTHSTFGPVAILLTIAIIK
jgi:hypothetical protein